MEYDLTVIGGGPGGYVAAIRAAQLGMKTVLVERDSLGGTCLNRGCIPTKIYYHQAGLLRSVRSLDSFNITLDQNSVHFDFPGALARKNKMVSDLTAGIAGLLQSNGVTVVKGEAKITSPKTVTVLPLSANPDASSSGEPVTLETKRILIATGSESTPLPVPGLDEKRVIDSTGALNLSEIPTRLVIIGGGVIGVEFASIFKSFGSDVTIIEAMDRILPPLDSEISKRMLVCLKKQGIGIRTGTFLQSVARSESGILTLTLKDGKGESTLEADTVLVAVGRRARTDGLGLESLGVEMNRGFIVVNEKYESSVPGIWAVGDVAGRGMLAHLASEEGKVAVEIMTGLSAAVSYHAIPACVFSFPEIASVGQTTESAANNGTAVQVGKFLFASNGKARSMGEIDGFVKILADEKDIIIGVHIIGPHAADLILEGTVLVDRRVTVDEALSIIHPHPTLGEVLAEALLDLKHRAIHLAAKKR